MNRHINILKSIFGSAFKEQTTDISKNHTVKTVRALPYFNAIKFEMTGKLTCQPSTDKNSGIVIVAEERLLESITTEVKDSCLYISGDNINTQTSLEFTVYAPSPVTLFEITGGVTEDSHIDVGFAQDVKIRVNGIGNFIVKGSVNSFDVNINGVSEIDATQLVIKDSLKADISGVGKLFLKERPKNSVERVSGIGKIKIKG